MDRILGHHSSNIKLDLPSQNIHEFGSFPSFEESIPLEQNQMLRIPHINVALAPDSETGLDIYGVQIYEEPIDNTEHGNTAQSEGNDMLYKNFSIQRDDIINVEMSSQTKHQGDNTEHVR